MTPPEVAPTRARSRRGQPGPPWTFIILVALAALSTSDLRAQEWRFDAIDRRFVDQQRATDLRFDHVDRRLQLQQHAIDGRFNHLNQQLQRLNKELWDHRLSHQDIRRTQGLVSASVTSSEDCSRRWPTCAGSSSPLNRAVRSLPTSAGCPYDTARSRLRCP